NLIDTYDLTQEQVAKKVGKSRPVVANALRLLSLPGEILPMVEAGDISAGHARALLGTQEKEEMHRMALLIKQGKMSVRDVEQAIQKGKKVAQQPKIEEQDNNKKAPTEQEAIPIVSTENWGESHFKEMELALEGELGRKIKIVGNPKTNIGTIEIPFYNEAEMADIAERLANTKWHR
ncbi:MAG: ParB/RepB/Spo0J family partition protein, partial [Oscillospiraceae bacterium]